MNKPLDWAAILVFPTREELLKHKRINGGLTFAEAVEILQIQRLRQLADEMSEHNSEGRLLPESRPNFHE